MIATVLLSQGVPMILAGDEFGRTQQGNNNAYCQDNEINWVDWSLCETDAEFLTFVKSVVALRQSEPLLRLRKFVEGESDSMTATWSDPDGNPMQDHQWQESYARCVSLLLTDTEASGATKYLLIVFNASKEAMDVRFPNSAAGRAWQCRLNTSQNNPINEDKVADKFLMAASSLCVYSSQA